MRATRERGAQRSSGSELPGIAAAGHHLRRPRAATRTGRARPTAIWTRGCGSLPAAMRSWRQRPGGALTISLAPSAEALCHALVGNGRRLPAIMRPSAPPAGR